MVVRWWATDTTTIQSLFRANDDILNWTGLPLHRWRCKSATNTIASEPIEQHNKNDSNNNILSNHIFLLPLSRSPLPHTKSPTHSQRINPIHHTIHHRWKLLWWAIPQIHHLSIGWSRYSYFELDIGIATSSWGRWRWRHWTTEVCVSLEGEEVDWFGYIWQGSLCIFESIGWGWWSSNRSKHNLFNVKVYQCISIQTPNASNISLIEIPHIPTFSATIIPIHILPHHIIGIIHPPRDSRSNARIHTTAKRQSEESTTIGWVGRASCIGESSLCSNHGGDDILPDWVLWWG